MDKPNAILGLEVVQTLTLVSDVYCCQYNYKIVRFATQPVIYVHFHIGRPIGPNECNLGTVLGRHFMSFVKSGFEARPFEAKVVEAEPRVWYELQMKKTTTATCKLHCNWYIYFLSNKCLPGIV